MTAGGIETPSLDARLLIGHVLNLSRTDLLLQSKRPISSEELAAINAVIARRLQHEPVARIIGEQEFWGMPFRLNHATLIPRPDSETLIEAVVRLRRESPPQQILDLGTGSGCLLLALLSEFPEAFGVGVDRSFDAARQAQENANYIDTFLIDKNPKIHRHSGNILSSTQSDETKCNPESSQPIRKSISGNTAPAAPLTGFWINFLSLCEKKIFQNDISLFETHKRTQFLPLASRAAFVVSDWLESLTGKFDLIVSNPPYITSEDVQQLMPDVRDYDPTLALDGGADGLAAYRVLIPALPDYLSHDGMIALEVGKGQIGEVIELCKLSGFRQIITHKDLNGIERVVTAGSPSLSPSL